MGIKILQRALRKRAAAIIVMSVILILICAFMALVFAVAGDFGFPFIFFAVLTLLSVLLLVRGIKEGSIKTNRWIKLNPDLLSQAEELFDNIVYEDKYIVCSNKHVANKKNPLSIVAFDEILGMHESKTRVYFFITVYKELTIVTKKSQMSIAAASSKKIEELMGVIAAHCPDARVGYSPDNAAFYNEEQMAFKGKLTRK